VASQIEELQDGEAIEAEPPGELPLEEAVRLAALEGTPKAAVRRAAPPVQRRLESRIVKIDTARLAARNILTPETKRNRTVEEFRLIKRMVLSRRWGEGGAPGNTIVVTSALPSEGKTTMAINLAMSIAAEEDLRVLLVDADFIKPDALRQLGITASKGLIDVLQNPSVDISEVMLRTNIEKLSLIPSGQLHERCTELLASARMDEIIAELASRYQDRILIFDSPPLLVTTEAVALASHMGQIVFVIQAGRTKRESVTNALEMIGEGPQLGLVLNRTTARFGNLDFGSYYGAYNYGYGYGHGHAADQTEQKEA
jgi:receptor protein-tyrosine kinase